MGAGDGVLASNLVTGRARSAACSIVIMHVKDHMAFALPSMITGLRRGRLEPVKCRSTISLSVTADVEGGRSSRSIFCRNTPRCRTREVVPELEIAAG